MVCIFYVLVFIGIAINTTCASDTSNTSKLWYDNSSNTTNDDNSSNTTNDDNSSNTTNDDNSSNTGNQVWHDLILEDDHGEGIDIEGDHNQYMNAGNDNHNHYNYYNYPYSPEASTVPTKKSSSLTRHLNWFVFVFGIVLLLIMFYCFRKQSLQCFRKLFFLSGPDQPDGSGPGQPDGSDSGQPNGSGSGQPDGSDSTRLDTHVMLAQIEHQQKEQLATMKEIVASKYARRISAERKIGVSSGPLSRGDVENPFQQIHSNESTHMQVKDLYQKAQDMEERLANRV